MASSGESYKSSDDEDFDFSKSSDEEWTGDFESSSSDDIVQKWVKSVQLLLDNKMTTGFVQLQLSNQIESA